MRQIRNVILITLAFAAVFYLFDQIEESAEVTDENLVATATLKLSVIHEKAMPGNIVDSLEGEIFHWMGKGEKELAESLGEPERIDISAYGYEWWIYRMDGKYLQFGFLSDEIKTIYMNGGDGIEVGDFALGMTYDDTRRLYPFEKEVTYGKGLSFFTFRLTDEDLSSRPLVKLNDTSFAQLYFDTYTERLSSIRLLDGEILLRHLPYEVQYRGSLPQEPELDGEQWKKVEEAMEKQIFDITNVIRDKHGMKQLVWDDTVSQVAYAHSKDMADNNYFSHFSQNGDGLKERLAEEEVFYRAAGENIAAQYPDAASAVEGWLNSDGHREALLSEEYSHLGVGVYRFHYTQNFLDRPL